MILDFIFYVSWILLLLGLFILAREILVQWLRNENLAIFGAFLTTIVILFEAILILEEHKWRDDTFGNQFQRWLFGKQPSEHWKWHVNPITVPFSLCGRIVVLAASVFGESSGVFTSRFLDSLPLSTSLLMVPFTFSCFLLAIFCLFGYQFNIGYGFLKIENGGDSNWRDRVKSMFRRISKPSTRSDDSKKNAKVITGLDNCVKRVNERYQRAIHKHFN